MEQTYCRYFPTVQCDLAPNAPACDMLCELNEDAKQEQAELNKKQNKVFEVKNGQKIV